MEDWFIRIVANINYTYTQQSRVALIDCGERVLLSANTSVREESRYLRCYTCVVGFMFCKQCQMN